MIANFYWDCSITRMSLLADDFESTSAKGCVEDRYNEIKGLRKVLRVSWELKKSNEWVLTTDAVKSKKY